MNKIFVPNAEGLRKFWFSDVFSTQIWVSHFLSTHSSFFFMFLQRFQQLFIFETVQICGNKKHPIGQLMDELEVVFRATYEASSAVHRRLLPHSISELKSITTRLTDTIGYLLPCIDPKYSKQNSQMSRNSDDSDNQRLALILSLKLKLSIINFWTYWLLQKCTVRN